MTIDLPPRRDLPADVKERMRPHFTGVRQRRNNTPLAVAAAVALLIAGGFAVTQSGTHDAAPGHGRVVMPSNLDLTRCRTALNDQNWSSTEMVVFGVRKVLVGTDGRFCELTRSRAGVAPPGFQPTQLAAGSITYRSGQVIAGVPPLGARTAKAREVGPAYSRGSSDGVVTPDFFIVHSESAMRTNELVFDERTVPIPQLLSMSAEGNTDSFESGGNDLWTPANLLARCIDDAFNNSTSADELQGWEPMLISGLDQRHGMLLAHRDHRQWATCVINPFGPQSLSLIRTTYDNPDASLVVGGYQTGSEFIMVGRTNRSAKSVEVSDSGGPPVTADVADGHFIARLPISGDEMISPARLHVVARNADKEIVYEGGIS